MNDLISVGVLGLIDAATRYRPSGDHVAGGLKGNLSTRSDPPSDDINRIWLEVNDSERAYAIHFPSGDH